MLPGLFIHNKHLVTNPSIYCHNLACLVSYLSSTPYPESYTLTRQTHKPYCHTSTSYFVFHKRSIQKKKKIAHTRIRTEDLIITSDALCQLSHASFLVLRFWNFALWKSAEISVVIELRVQIEYMHTSQIKIKWEQYHWAASDNRHNCSPPKKKRLQRSPSEGCPGLQEFPWVHNPTYSNASTPTIRIQWPRKH